MIARLTFIRSTQRCGLNLSTIDTSTYISHDNGQDSSVISLVVLILSAQILGRRIHDKSALALIILGTWKTTKDVN